MKLVPNCWDQAKNILSKVDLLPQNQIVSVWGSFTLKGSSKGNVHKWNYNNKSKMNQYRLGSKKGDGTFSEVFKATSILTGQNVAIKCMKKHY